MPNICVNLIDISNFGEANINYNDGLICFSNSFSGIEEAIRQCKQELEKNECNKVKAIQLIENAREKQKALEAERDQLQREVEELEQQLSGCKDARAAAAIAARIARLQKRIKEIKEKIEKVKLIIANAEELLQTTKENINVLNRVITDLTKTLNALVDNTTKMRRAIEGAIRCLMGSQKCVQQYIDTTFERIPFKFTESVELKRCANFSYAGKVYDYQCYLDKYEETKDERFLNLYKRLSSKYKITFSELDKYGNSNPDFAKYELLHVTFDEVNEENLRKGTCLVGDSSANSPDFKLLTKKLLEMGYSPAKIKELYSLTNRHHDPDGRTIRLVPKDLHSNVIL